MTDEQSSSWAALARDAIVAACITLLAWHMPGDSTIAIAAGILGSIAGANASARGSRVASQSVTQAMTGIAASLRPPPNTPPPIINTPNL